MRIAKLLAIPAIATLTLAGCTSTVRGSASPTDSAQSTVEQVSKDGFDVAAARDLLLDKTDLPDYQQLPDMDLGDVAGGFGAPDVNDVTVDPPQCAEAVAQGSMQDAAALLDQAAMRLLLKGSTPADIGVVAEILMPASALQQDIEKLDLPPACSSVTITKDGEQIAVTLKQIPLNIGASSAAMSMTMTGEVSGQPIDMTMSLGMIVESKGAIMLAVTGADLVTIAHAAYDKALPVLN